MLSASKTTIGFETDTCRNLDPDPPLPTTRSFEAGNDLPNSNMSPASAIEIVMEQTALDKRTYVSVE